MASPIVNIKFLADLKQFSTQMQNSARQMDGFAKKLESVGTTLTVGLTAPLAGLAAVSLNNFDKQAKAVAQVEQGLKSTGNAAGFLTEELLKQASALQNNSLFGDEEILQGVTAQLLTFTNIANEQFTRTQQAALDLATRLDGDLKSASIQLAKALNDPIANLSALSESGIQFSKEQKTLINSLAETGRLAEAQTLILNELEKQYGGSAAAAARAGTGPLKQLQNILGDITEEFGAIIAEGILPFVEKAKELAAGFQSLSPQVKKFIVIAGGIAALVGPLLAIAGTVLPALATGFTLLTGPVGIAVAAIAGIGIAIYKNWEPIKKTLIDVANYFIDLYNESVAFRFGVEAVRVAFKNMFEGAKFAFQTLVEIVTLAAKNIVLSFKTIGKVIKAVLTGDFDAVPGIIRDAFNEGFGNLKGVFSKVKDNFGVLKETTQANVQEGINAALRGKYKLLGDSVDTSEVTEKVKSSVEAGVTGQENTAFGRPKQDELSSVSSGGTQLFNTSITGTNILTPLSEQLDPFVEQMLEFERISGEILSNVAANFIEGFTSILIAAAGGKAGFADIAAFLLNTMADLAQQLGRAAIAAGATMKGIRNLFNNPAGAIAAGVALVAVAGLLRSVASSFGGGGEQPQAFASGGIVGGGSYYGDKILARLNSGELVLNQSQQRDLYNMVDRTPRSTVVGGTLVADGRQLKVLLQEVDAFEGRIK